MRGQTAYRNDDFQDQPSKVLNAEENSFVSWQLTNMQYFHAAPENLDKVLWNCDKLLTLARTLSPSCWCSYPCKPKPETSTVTSIISDRQKLQQFSETLCCCSLRNTHFQVINQLKQLIKCQVFRLLSVKYALMKLDCCQFCLYNIPPDSDWRKVLHFVVWSFD